MCKVEKTWQLFAAYHFLVHNSHLIWNKGETSASMSERIDFIKKIFFFFLLMSIFVWMLPCYWNKNVSEYLYVCNI